MLTRHARCPGGHPSSQRVGGPSIVSRSTKPDTSHAGGMIALIVFRPLRCQVLTQFLLRPGGDVNGSHEGYYGVVRTYPIPLLPFPPPLFPNSPHWSCLKPHLPHPVHPLHPPPALAESAVMLAAREFRLRRGKGSGSTASSLVLRPIGLCSCYAVSGTDVPCGSLLDFALPTPCPGLKYSMVVPAAQRRAQACRKLCDVRHSQKLSCYAIAKRSPVLTQGMPLLPGDVIVSIDGRRPTRCKRLWCYAFATRCPVLTRDGRYYQPELAPYHATGPEGYQG
eukprot:1981772-Rhodomonas_salina.3